MESIKKIYFDMDGVLADFDRGVEELAGFEHLNQADTTEEQDNAMWAAIAKVERFYDKLELMPGAKEMFDTIYNQYGDKCEILTGIPKPKRGIASAGEDKISWVRRLLSKDIKINIVFKEEKPQYCTGEDCILIDDLKGNIDAWRKMGGTGILHENSELTLCHIGKLTEEQ